MDYTSYVAGFLFRRNGAEVALIRKEKPAWQKGRLNGIGGKVEAGESAKSAMIREFREETGAGVFHWRRFCTLHVSDASIDFFESRMGDRYALTSTTDEEVQWFSVGYILERGTAIVPNLRWLIPMALDPDRAIAIVHNGATFERQVNLDFE